MSQNKIRLRPLIPTSTGIFCHLLTIDETKIVINCGIDKNFDFNIYDNVKNIIETADCILLTSFELSCIGAIGLFKESVIYCSIPTAILGKIILEEANHILGSKFLTNFIPRQVKYSQPFKINDVDIVSFNTGYVVGNSSFRITHGSESISVCYNFNHRKENFLDGLMTSAIENTDIVITNTIYVHTPTHNIKSRNDILQQIISNTSGSVVIAVNYSRFFEILACLYNFKITVVSKNSKMLVERVKSMVEWAGSKATEIIPLFDVEYCKVSEIEDQKLIIVVDDFSNDGYLGSVLEKLNSENNSIVAVYPKKIEFDKLKIYGFSYTKIEDVEDVITVEIDSEESDENRKYHWSKEKKTFFVNGQLKTKDYFPFIKRRRQNNEYGEKVNFEFSKKVEEVELKPGKVVSEEEIEELFLVKTGLQPNLKVYEIECHGNSDLNSARTVLESLQPSKIIFTNDSVEDSLFLSSYFLFNENSIQSYVCDKEIFFNSLGRIQKALVSEKAMELNKKKLADKNVICFKAIKNDNLIDCIGPSNPIVIGKINSEIIRKSLIELGFQVETSEDKLIVNEALEIKFEENNLSVFSSENNLLVSVREVLYKYICIVR